MKASEPKVLLVGESNPYGSDPYYALYPSPYGCAGHRLCHKVLMMTDEAYLKTFVRMNLCAGKWNMTEARSVADFCVCSYPLIVLLGSKVCKAFNVPFQPFAVHDGMLIFPHPSGLCRLWAEQGAYSQARQAIVRYAPELESVIGGKFVGMGS